MLRKRNRPFIYLFPDQDMRPALLFIQTTFFNLIHSKAREMKRTLSSMVDSEILFPLKFLTGGPNFQSCVIQEGLRGLWVPTYARYEDKVATKIIIFSGHVMQSLASKGFFLLCFN